MKKNLISLVACATISLASTSMRADAPQLENSKVRELLNEMQGKPAPKLALKGWINSKPMSLEKLKGKIVVLDFWATWCGPCIASVPHTNEMLKQYTNKGVVFIGSVLALWMHPSLCDPQTEPAQPTASVRSERPSELPLQSVDWYAPSVS